MFSERLGIYLTVAIKMASLNCGDFSFLITLLHRILNLSF